MKTILNEHQLAITIKRLSRQLLENHMDLRDTVIIGIQPRGVFLSDHLVAELKSLVPPENIKYGRLDITFYRDDIRSRIHLPNHTDIPFTIEQKNVILVDDVLHTGRTIRAAMDALLDFGRPSRVELCTLIDRRFSRELPIQPDYVGKYIDSIISQRVKVFWMSRDNKQEVALLEGSSPD